MKRFVLAAVLAVLCAIPGGAALATGTPPHCVYDDHYTSTTTLTNHPDSGNHGDWATDDFKRVVKICEVGDTKVYHATVEDNGHFTTITGAQSPNAGIPIKGTVTGEMWGGFTADFTAAPNFATYMRGHHGATTSTWVAGYFSDFKGSSINEDWSWSYRSKCEKWTDAADNGNGALPEDGDITGCTCPPEPSPSPSESPSPSPSESPSATPSGGSGSGTTVTAAAEGTTPGLPSTGLAGVS